MLTNDTTDQSAECHHQQRPYLSPGRLFSRFRSPHAPSASKHDLLKDDGTFGLVNSWITAN